MRPQAGARENEGKEGVMGRMEALIIIGCFVALIAALMIAKSALSANRRNV